MSRHWSVTVESSGERLLTIESSHLSGKAELTAEDEATICTAALHLLSFIGKPGTGEIERLRAGLHKIASCYPCATAKDMSRVAGEALGLVLAPTNSEKSG